MKYLSCLYTILILGAFSTDAHSGTPSQSNAVDFFQHHPASQPGLEFPRDPDSAAISDEQTADLIPNSENDTATRLAQASGSGETKFAVARNEIPKLGLSMHQGEPCQRRRTCPFTFEITNTGVWPYAGFLVIINAMPVPVRVGSYTPGWRCGAGQTGETLCITDVTNLFPGKTVKLELPLTPRKKITAGNALVCTAFLWPAGWTALEDDEETIQLFQFAANLQGFRAGPNDGKMGRRTKAAFKRALADSDEEEEDLTVENLAYALFGDGFPVPTRASEEVEHCTDVELYSKSSKPKAVDTSANSGQAGTSTAPATN